MNIDVLVVGSANRDWRATVDRLPRPGETLMAREAHFSGGGKGANQAVAAARAGATVALVGATGDDAVGRELRAELEAAGVDTSELKSVVGVPTGTAFITVASDGENVIVVDAGANHYASLDADRDDLRALVVVAQAEVPVPVFAAAARLAARHGARFVFNAAPVPSSIEDVPRGADPLVVNEHEAAILLGSYSGDPEGLGQALLVATQARSVVVTLGSRGSVTATNGGSTRTAATPVERVVDTTGAGDTFTGALAAHLALGRSLPEATSLAAEAAAESVGWQGARPPLASITN